MLSTSGMFSTVHRSTFEDTMSTSGDIMSTLGEIPRVHWGYHEYIGGCSLHLGDIMMHVEEQVDKSLSIYIENPDVLMISPTCIMVSLLGVLRSHYRREYLPWTSKTPPHAIWS